MNLLAIDPGTNEMGLMYLNWERPLTLRLSALSIVRYKNKTIKPLREWRLADMMFQLELMFEKHIPECDTVIFERPFCRGADATRSLWGIAGIIEAVATKHGCTCLDIDNSTLKKFALGRVGPVRDKEPMIAMASVMGYDGLNEHEADALMLYYYGMENITTGD